jgi:hypothetical protein
MSRENPWTKHRQSFWEGKTASAGLPLWLRVTALAFGTHRRNGHAPKKPGEIGLATSITDVDTGEIKTPSPSRVSEAIRQAIELGFLHRDSTARCLIVPPWAIEGGTLGRANEECKLHGPSGKTGKSLRIVPEIPEATSGNTGTDNALTCDDDDALLISSQPKPDRRAQ